MSRLQHVGSFLLLLTMILSVTVSARAEYRSALLISNTEYKAESDQVEPRDLTKLSTDLAKYGFDCQVQENLLNEKAIRAEILYKTDEKSEKTYTYEDLMEALRD